MKSKYIINVLQNVAICSYPKRYFFNTVIIIILSFVVPGCKKFIGIDPPTDRLVTETVFRDVTTATAAQTAIYTQMEKYSYYMALYTGLLDDELQNWSTFPLNTELYTNNVQPANSPGIWNDAYSYIYQANAIIEGLTNNIYLQSAVINQLTGEAKFIRAFWYFYLTNLFGEVPLVLTTDYSINASLPRMSQTDVYNQIKADLTEAKNLLNSNYVDGTSVNTTSERIRPTKWAASAFLSRVYLFTGDYNAASTEAIAVINNSSFSLKSNLSDVFLKNSSEAIWQIQIPLPASANTTAGRYFILTGNPTPGANESTTISSQLLNAFDTNDKRKINWIGSVTTTSGTHPFPYKYKVKNVTTVTEYTMVLRLAEQYLIRAEAQAQLNNTSAAISDLNIIRNRAGLSNYSGASDKISVLNAILREGQLELFTEWGDRWLSLKRTNTIDATMNIVTPLKGGSWQTTDKLLPLPLSEVNANPTLIQNAGY